MTVAGHHDPAFAGVRALIAEQIADGRDLGCAVAVYLDGRPVVDLWAGVADRRSGRPWEHDTSCLTYSCTKAVTATAALAVSAATGIDVLDPVTRWWPEYAAHGKGSTTLADLLAHRAGLPAFEDPVTAEQATDPAALAARLAAQRPLWEPGTRHGYHALTFGWLAGEFVRRRSGRTVADYVRESFDPALCLGVPPPTAARATFPAGVTRRADAGDDAAARLARAYADPGSLMMRGSMNPTPSFSDPVVQAGGWPAAGLFTTARALAGFYRDLVGGALLPGSVLREATREQVRGPDEVLLLTSTFGLGYMLPSPTMPLPAAARAAFGHPGAGGSLGLADAEHSLAFAYVTNLRRDARDGDRRAYDLVEAVYAAL
ncbi:serine hydrolase domain-containing protein [Nocardia thailandica]|uniref:Serine hydrolase domain-containing protein n=1 Tax=Nocardia thailandica TaxID=257275 RepID=A0ABW6PVF9_9NOCA